MFIGEFAKKYGVDRRSVDYWTNLGLIHADYDKNGIYRGYGDLAEREIKEVLVAKAMNHGSLEECTELVRHIPKGMVDDIIIKRIREEMDQVMERYKRALEYAYSMRD